MADVPSHCMPLLLCVHPTGAPQHKRNRFICHSEDMFAPSRCPTLPLQSSGQEAASARTQVEQLRLNAAQQGAAASRAETAATSLSMANAQLEEQVLRLDVILCSTT